MKPKTPLTPMMAALVCLSACTVETITGQNEWTLSSREDLQAAHKIMLESHPGPLDEENPGFIQQADATLENAMRQASVVTDEAGYGAVLRAYTAGFRDGHFVVFPKSSGTGTTEDLWPGLMPAWRAGKVEIVHAEPDQADLLSAELLSCDGAAVTDLILQHVFQFDPAKPDQEAYWARRSPLLFFHLGNPIVPRLDTCRFRLASGETVTRPLRWRESNDETWQLRWHAAFGLRPETDMREVRPGEFWINLPDFSPDEEGVQNNRAVFAEIRDRRSEMRNAKSIVIDMRGNQGGSSAWGAEMIDALWGEAYPNSRQIDYNTYVEWRLSEDNIAHMAFIVDYVTQNGHDESTISYFRSVHENSKLAFAEGRDFYTQVDDDENRVENQPVEVANPVKTPIYFLTHGTCASACLDFADALFELEGVTHIGYPTSSDTNYMEVRQQDLPSGRGVIAIPTKVYRNRARKSGAFYEPIYKYDGFDWSDEAIEAWVSTVVLPQSAE